MKNNATFKFKIKESVQYASHANNVIINTALTRALVLFNFLNTQKKITFNNVKIIQLLFNIAVHLKTSLNIVSGFCAEYALLIHFEINSSNVIVNLDSKFMKS